MATVNELLSAYRADREPVVVLIERIDTTITHLQPRLGHLDAANLSRQVFLDYTQQRVADGVQPQTARRELVTLRAALRLAWKDGVLERVPHVPLPPAGMRRERILSAVEIRRLLAASTPWPRCHAFVRLLAGTCGRASAVCELTWDRVDLEHGEIDLRSPHPRAARRKGRAVVPVGEQLVTFLRAYRNWPGEGRRRGRRANPEQRVVGLSVSGARRQLGVAATSAGIRGVTPHVIRHSVATEMLRSGVPLHVVSRMLGHASVAITADVYGHLVTRDLRPAADVLEAWSDSALQDAQ